MKVVIDIDENLYTRLFDNGVDNYDDTVYMAKAIRKGIPLPKEHGKLKDTDKIANEINALKDNWNRYGNDYEGGRYDSYDYAVDVIEDAPTIIPTESEKEE